MKKNRILYKALTSPLVAAITLYGLMTGIVNAAEDEAAAVAFPD